MNSSSQELDISKSDENGGCKTNKDVSGGEKENVDTNKRKNTVSSFSDTSTLDDSSASNQHENKKANLSSSGVTTDTAEIHELLSSIAANQALSNVNQLNKEGYSGV
jgi:hypothetical protein